MIQDFAVFRVNFKIIFFAVGVEFHVIDPTSIFIIQFCTDEGNIFRQQIAVSQSNVFRGFSADISFCNFFFFCFKTVCVSYSKITAEGNGLCAVIPYHVFIHDLADSTQRQVCAAIVQNRIYPLTSYRIEFFFIVFHYNGEVRAFLHTDIFFANIGIVFVRRSGIPFAADGDDFILFIPVYIFAHQFANGTQRQIGCAFIQDRIYRIAAGCFKIHFVPIHNDGKIRAKLCICGTDCCPKSRYCHCCYQNCCCYNRKTFLHKQDPLFQTHLLVF